MNSPCWLWIWGKTDLNGISRARGGPAWNPLLAHCLDTAAVCGALFDHYLAANVRARLADAFGSGNAALARKHLMLLAALHDMPGKAHPGNQLRFPDGTDRHDPQLRTAGQQWLAQARAAGLLLDSPLRRPHAHVTARYLPALLGCRCTTCLTTLPDAPPVRGPRHEALHDVARLLGGHHGHLPDDSRIARANCTLTAHWHHCHHQLLAELARLIDVDVTAIPGHLDLTRPSALPLFAGLVVHSDWLASDESRFPYRTLETPTDHWWDTAQQQAAACIRDRYLTRWEPDEAPWHILMPHAPQPRPAQQLLMDHPPTGPVMVIAESGTGAGKTEQALWLTHHLARTCGYHGAYIAQATRAASEQLLTRVRTFLDHAPSRNPHVSLALVHGTASISAAARELALPQPGTADLAGLINLDDCDDGDTRAVLDTWFLDRGRGLLSVWGIGTVDQIALAAQRSRHWFLRLYALANKTVVIDEAHAYQPYQQRLLDAAIAWLADAGASIVILSATLPASIRNSLTTAWCTGHQTTLNGTPTGPITVIDSTGNHRTLTPPPLPHAPNQRTRLHLRPDPGPDLLAAHLLATHQHGATGVIRDRVDTSIDLYRAATRLAEDGAHGWEPGQILLLHARFFERDRARHERTLITKLGPHPDPDRRATAPNPHRPDRFLLIGTPVLEQSLDYDLDNLYADLTPLHLLFQSRGRLYRHLLNHPHAHDEIPDLQLLWTPDDDHLPHLPGAHGHALDPFEAYLRTATWHALHRRARATRPAGAHPDTLSPLHLTPDHLPLLLREIFDLAPPHGSKPIHHRLRSLHAARQRRLAKEAEQAEERVLTPFLDISDITTPLPTPAELLVSGSSHGDPDDPDHQPHLAALSRLGERTVSIIGLYQQPTGERSWDPEGTFPADLTPYHPHIHPDSQRHQQRELLLNTVRLRASWFLGKQALPDPATWAIPHAPALKSQPVLLLTPQGQPVDNRLAHKLTYSPDTGLSRT
ncbi:CRISPR-associated helicase Cas3' [Streptomyces noboritoensis]|uniref:CRISPR-associated helicase Cas3 n=1 Tax=Streptomyces noboritoensis TaxID=67337 RepID=A0ABV6TGB7_9ACTN